MKNLQLPLRLFVVIFICLGSVEAFAQEEKSAEDLVKLTDDIMKGIDQEEKKVEISRDPFSSSQINTTGTISDGLYEFFPVDSSAQLPRLQLRGYIADEDGEPMALLDIANHGVFLVRTGDTVGLNVSGRSTVLKVKKISNLSVLVEVGTIGQVVIVR